MDKHALLQSFANQVAADLAVMTQAALAAHEAATHAESKAEDQYDTRGLEASYLAGAQSKRAMELEEILSTFRHVDVKSFGPEDRIASTALIELRSEGSLSYYLLMPNGGGLTTQFEGKKVTVVTPQSPTGSVLLGQRVGDEVEVEIQRRKRDLEITRIW